MSRRRSSFFGLAAYDNYNAGELEDVALDDRELERALWRSWVCRPRPSDASPPGTAQGSVTPVSTTGPSV
jgi:hypothetical protein